MGGRKVERRTHVENQFLSHLINLRIRLICEKRGQVIEDALLRTRPWVHSGPTSKDALGYLCQAHVQSTSGDNSFNACGAITETGPN